MKRIKYKYLLYNILLTIVAWAVLYVATKNILPDSFGLAIAGLVFSFFLVFQLGFIWLCRRVQRSARTLPLSYMLIKMIKFILMIALVVIYCAVIKYNIKAFLVCFAACYIVWLAFDTVMFMKFQKENKIT